MSENSGSIAQEQEPGYPLDSDVPLQELAGVAVRHYGDAIEASEIEFVSGEESFDAFARDASHIPRLDAKAEAELANRARAGDQAAAWRLAEANLFRAVRVARTFAGRGVPLSDLAAEAGIALFNAAQQFNPDHSSGASFGTYGTRWAINACLRATLTERRRANHQMPIDTDERDEDEAATRDPLIDPRPGPDELAEERAWRTMLIEAFENGLIERQRLVLALRFGLLGRIYTHEEIANLLHVSRGRPPQIESRALEKLSRDPIGRHLKGYL